MSALNQEPLATDFGEIPEPIPNAQVTAAHAQFGKLFQPQQQILLYSAEEWELFVLEWVHSQRSKYTKVLRFSGANDMGIDVAGFADHNGLFGVWDNFQCKHYGAPLTPGTALGEIAKIMWHSFKGKYSPPRHYYFIAPKDCGMALKSLLLNPDRLKSHVQENWDKQCANAVSSKFSVLLEGDFATYVNEFPFAIFTMRTTLEVIDEHRTTPYYVTRFGGGLKPRPKVVSPAPEEIDAKESRYVEQLLEAYGDHLKATVSGLPSLSAHPHLVKHFHRQREFFYHAESLRNFARDTVPPGTFEDLQSEVHAGVIDIEMAPHPDGLARLTEVTKVASTLQLTANPLIATLMVQDRKGICHQLANEDRLRWKRP